MVNYTKKNDDKISFKEQILKNLVEHWKCSHDYKHFK